MDDINDIFLHSPLVVFKGGTAFNGVLRKFQEKFSHVAYIVPVTDDGGSSREISRVFGGPSIGDLRSTLTRLSDESSEEACAVKRLLEHRLPNNPTQAQSEWYRLLEDNHDLYYSISSKYKELIRYFLRAFDAERLHRISSRFEMGNGSVGNFFFSGARLALGSLETAVFMYSSVARIPSTTVVLPVIDCNEQLGLCVELESGDILVGQHAISHPDEIGHVDKKDYKPLSSPIKALFYVDRFQNIISPRPHPEVLKKIAECKGVIYGMGSFWTSIVPSLVLEGVGENISQCPGPKIALLNCCYDRETMEMTASEYIFHLTNSLNRYGVLNLPSCAYITHLCVVEGCEIPVDEFALNEQGIEVIRVASDEEVHLEINNDHYPVFDNSDLIRVLLSITKDFSRKLCV